MIDTETFINFYDNLFSVPENVFGQIDPKGKNIIYLLNDSPIIQLTALPSKCIISCSPSSANFRAAMSLFSSTKGKHAVGLKQYTSAL